MESNVKICLNCKYCSYNILRKKRNKFQKFLDKIFGNIELELSKMNPKCWNENVYDESDYESSEYLVTGAIKKHQLYCMTARTYSTKRFHCCEESGKYFEEYKED